MAAERPIRRCAVYTRKSSEEGLEQDFNSLDAQREACEAYIRSQAGEGWKLLKTRYDDGGYSGGTMDRPGLIELLADVRERKLDTVVVYKVNRLTRSLADFAKIVEVFDANGVSFVSVTQQFNTTTSIGRLTLSMLLSFAQSPLYDPGVPSTTSGSRAPVEGCHETTRTPLDDWVGGQSDGERTDQRRDDRNALQHRRQ